jgi:hypothetical protein
MMKLALALLIASANVLAYVPTVESLFRNASNPDVTTNTAAITLKVTRTMADGEKPLEEGEVRRGEDFYKLFITRLTADSLKISQARYNNNSFSEGSLEHKMYQPNFTPHSLRAKEDQIQKGIFFSLMRSLIFNDSSHLIVYLKTLGVPVRLNNELINREKIALLAEYKRYLISTNRDKKKGLENPLRPEDSNEREKVERIMDESMYVDTKQVKLTREGGEMAWMVSAGVFESVVSYDKKHVQRLKYRSEVGEFEITCKDYWLSNGTHYMPKYLAIKTFTGKTFQVDISGYRLFNENEAELVRRLQRWEQLLRGKEIGEQRPEFLL